MEESIRQIAIWALPVLIAVVFHEVSHGWIAYQLGDPTAARLGRLTLNPFAHVDLFGTILVPLILIVSNAPFVFGYAKPVPVNFSNLRNPKRDMIWVAAAGPAMNLLLAFFCSVAWKFLAPGITDHDPTDRSMRHDAHPGERRADGANSRSGARRADNEAQRRRSRVRTAKVLRHDVFGG